MINKLTFDIANFILKNNSHFFIEEIYDEFKLEDINSINIALAELINFETINIYDYGKTKIIYNYNLQEKFLNFKNVKNFFLTELKLESKLQKKLFKIQPLTLDEINILKNQKLLEDSEIEKIESALNNLENTLNLPNFFSYNLINIYDISLEHVLRKSTQIKTLNSNNIYTYNDFLNSSLSQTIKKNILKDIANYINIIENRNVINTDFFSEIIYHKFKSIFYSIKKEKLDLIKEKIELNGYIKNEIFLLLFDEYTEAIKEYIKNLKFISEEKLFENFSFLSDEYLYKIIISLQTNENILKTTVNNKTFYYFSFPSIIEKTINLDNKNKEIFLEKLTGKTLQSISEPLNLTRERVRQIIGKIIKTQYSTDEFIEEYYSYLFKNYSVSREIFEMFKNINGIITYNYLDLKYNKGKNNINDALNDTTLPKFIIDDLNIYFYRDYFKLGNDMIKIDRISIIKYILKNLATDGIDYETLTELYFDVIKNIPENKITNKILNLGRGLMNQLADSSFILWNLGKFRYYNITSNDYSELLDTLNLEQYKDVEISTLKFIRDYPELMKKYDIRDQYELHNLIKKIYPSSYINYGRMPTLEFGEANRQKQILDLLFDTAPIHKEDFAAEYEKIYGIEKPTFFSNYLIHLNMFLENDILKIDYQFLTPTELKIFKEKIKNDFYTTKELKNIFYNTFGYEENGKINPYTISELNFKNYIGYIVSKKFGTIHNYITSLFKNNPIVDLSKLTLSNISAVYPEISKLKRNFEIVEFEYRKYINIEELNKMGVTKEKISKYIVNILSKLEENEIFTIQYLKNKGFHYDIVENLPDYFYSSILIEIKEKIISRHSTKNVLMMNNSNTKIKILDILLENIVLEYNSLKTEEVIDIIKERYGIILEKYKLEDNILDNKNIYYDKENNTIRNNRHQ